VVDSVCSLIKRRVRDPFAVAITTDKET